MTISPRERAAHIACAVVLTVVVAGVIVALIVYFTSGPVMVKDCVDGSGGNVGDNDAQMGHKEKIEKVDKAVRKTEAVSAQAASKPSASARAANKPSANKSTARKPANKSVTNTNLARTGNGSGASSSFGQPSNLLNNLQTPQGTGRPSVQSMNTQVQANEFSDAFRQATIMAPHRNTIIEQPVLHSYQDALPRGDIPDSQTINQVYQRNANSMRSQGSLRYGQTDAYSQFMGNTANQTHMPPSRGASQVTVPQRLRQPQGFGSQN